MLHNVNEEILMKIENDILYLLVNKAQYHYDSLNIPNDLLLKVDFLLSLNKLTNISYFIKWIDRDYIKLNRYFLSDIVKYIYNKKSNNFALITNFLELSINYQLEHIVFMNIFWDFLVFDGNSKIKFEKTFNFIVFTLIIFRWAFFH